MAVSQGKMLGHYAWGPGGYKCSCCKALTTRLRKLAERREVRRDIRRELESAGRPGRDGAS